MGQTSAGLRPKIESRWAEEEQPQPEARRLIPQRLPNGQKVFPDSGTTLRIHVLEDEAPPPAPQQSKAALQFDPRLNATEQEIVRLMSIGRTPTDLVELLGLTYNALYQHRHRIYNKLGANTAAGAVGIALRRGLIK